MDLDTKAHLLSIGTIQLDEEETPGGSSPASTSGPGAGGSSIFFSSGDKIVRLSVVKSSPLRLVRSKEGASIFQGEMEVARGTLVSPLSHCPEQAYITVSERCIYDCKFCAVPKLMGGTKSLSQVLEIVENSLSKGSLRAISLTSGVEVSPEDEVLRVEEIIRALKRFDVPIGVSVCPHPGSSQILLEAGAVEVKYNIEVLDREIFSQVCPRLSFDGIMAGLEEGVQVFGRGRVFSNVIIGLGESDEVLFQGIDHLTDMGVIPVLRAVYPHPLRSGEVQMDRPDAERLLRLARHLKMAMERNGLRGDLSQTMCCRCTGCDLVPHRDL
jgi:biotin synthase-related radical SAM superfamily protein